MPTSASLPDIERLGRVQRLAFAYAPARWREDFAALMVLEAQFEDFVRKASEPVLGQMRLAWWRDRFSDDPANWPKGNPLLAQLANWGQSASGLGDVVDGWEVLLSARPLSEDAILSHAGGRAAGWRALAGRIGAEGEGSDIDRSAQRYALVDFAWSGVEESERAQALALARSLPRGGRLPRDLRPLAVLDGLTQRALATDRPPLSRASDMLRALRTGLFGG